MAEHDLFQSGTGPDFKYETAMACPVAGVDEAGRGPWAGPVVAGAVILDQNIYPEGLDDSKKLTRIKREALFAAIMELVKIGACTVGIGLASVEEIDRINILQASLLAMRRAVDNLSSKPASAIVDGNQDPGLLCPVKILPKADSLSLSVAAASIIAKVTRDRIMADLARDFPAYGWEKNAGYGVPQHQQALSLVGISPHHRKSFRPIRDLISKDSPVTD